MGEKSSLGCASVGDNSHSEYPCDLSDIRLDVFSDADKTGVTLLWVVREFLSGSCRGTDLISLSSVNCLSSGV